MIVRFENLRVQSHSKTVNMEHEKYSRLKHRSICALDGEVYWLHKMIDFKSHSVAIISPLYAWEVFVSDDEWGIFSLMESDDTYAKKLTNKIHLRHEDTEPGVSDRYGNQVYLQSYEADMIPETKIGDMFIFGDVSYVIKGFEVHRRNFAPFIMDRVIVVSHDVSNELAEKDRTTLVSGEMMFDPIKRFFAGISMVRSPGNLD